MLSSDRTTLLYDGVYTLAMRILNAVAAAGLGILTARVLGPAGKGVYALPMVQAGIVATSFTGLTSATSYFMLNARAGRSILRTALLAAAAAVFLGGGAVVVMAVFGHALWASVAALASLPAAAASCIVAGYAIGVRRVRGTTAITVGTTIVNLALVGAGFLIVGRSPWVAIVAWVGALNTAAVIAWIVLLVHSRRLERGEPVPMGAYLRFAAKAGGTNLVTLLNYRGDLYIVALLASIVSLGLYSVAVSASETLLIATHSAAIAISPHVGGMNRGAAAALTARCVRNNVLVSVVLCGLLFATAPLLVRVLYGGSFEPLVPALRVLLLGVVALSLGSPISTYFTLKLGKPEVPFVLSSISAAICIALAIVLVPAMGIVGAATASTVAYVAGQGVGIVIFARRTRVRVRSILLPTLEDVAFYMRSARRVLSDGRRLFFGGTAS